MYSVQEAARSADSWSIIIGVRGGCSGGAAAPSEFEKFQGKLCFQGKRKLLKNPEQSKIHIQYSEFKAPSVFQGKGKLQNPWM